jgi:tetratricopeptide (TPR) repeat protein
LNGTDAEAMFHYGLALAGAEMYDMAIEAWEHTLELDENHADAYFNLGVAYGGIKGDAEKAIALFEKALEIQPDHMLAANGLKQMKELS